MYFVPSLVETGPLVLENSIFLNFVNVVILFRYYLPLKRGVVLYLNTFEFLVYQTVIFAKFCWNWPSGFGKRWFDYVNVFFHYFVIISPWKGEWSFIRTHLNFSFTKQWFLPSLVEIGPVGLDYVNVFFFIISLLSPLWTGRVLLIPLLFTQRWFVLSLIGRV